MRIAYLMTKYPAVSHTFIRREILELERRGHSVLRLAIREADAPPVDPADQSELSKTLHCLSQPVSQLLLAQLRMAITRPWQYVCALCLAFKMGRRSERGTIAHLAYLVEAAYFAHVLRSHEIEHVHAHFATNAATVARMIRRLGGPPYSFTVHGIDLFDAPRSLDIAGKVADAAFVAAVCDFSAAQLMRWAAFADWFKIHVVHCGVTAELFEEARPIVPGSRTLVCVARLSPEKGHCVLIDALAQLVRAGEDVRLVLAGDGELRSELERRIRDSGLQDHVSLAGYVSEADVRQLLLESRALVLPSFAEGLPAVIMEAFALGRPVISTYVAGIPELVRPGENGWLVPPGNVEDLVQAMREALRMPEQGLQAMGDKGRELARSRHWIPREAEKLNALFQAHAASGTTDCVQPVFGAPIG